MQRSTYRCEIQLRNCHGRRLPTNYVQRVGRVTRGSKGSLAMGVTFCSEHSKHEMYYYSCWRWSMASYRFRRSTRIEAALRQWPFFFDDGVVRVNRTRKIVRFLLVCLKYNFSAPPYYMKLLTPIDPNSIGVQIPMETYNPGSYTSFGKCMWMSIRKWSTVAMNREPLWQSKSDPLWQ